MNAFELIGTERYRTSPFSVKCPHCGSVATYQEKEARFYPTHASYVAVDIAGADRNVLQGTIFGQCQCNNRTCEEYVHFLGSYYTEGSEVDDPPNCSEKFVIKHFFPAVPLIDIPAGVPNEIRSLLTRSFAPAFSDLSASGNLVRSAVEKILTDQGVARFIVSKGKRHRLVLHARIERLPEALQSYKNELLASKWIGNTATHDDLDVASLKLLYEIVEQVLEKLYGTKSKELSRAITEVNRRKGPRKPPSVAVAE